MYVYNSLIQYTKNYCIQKKKSQKKPLSIKPSLSWVKHNNKEDTTVLFNPIWISTFLLYFSDLFSPFKTAAASRRRYPKYGTNKDLKTILKYKYI